MICSSVIMYLLTFWRSVNPVALKPSSPVTMQNGEKKLKNQDLKTHSRLYIVSFVKGMCLLYFLMFIFTWNCNCNCVIYKFMTIEPRMFFVLYFHFTLTYCTKKLMIVITWTCFRTSCELSFFCNWDKQYLHKKTLYLLKIKARYN